MINNGAFIVLNFFLVMFSALALQAQEKVDDKIPLEDLLQEFQKSYGVNFNYAKDIIDGIELQKPLSYLNLSEAIEYLKEETKLNFSSTTDGFILVSRADSSSKICGIIYDQSSGAILSNATINYGNQNTISNSSGYFELDINDSNNKTLIISYLGYKTFIKIHKELDNKCHDILLYPEEEILSEITIPGFIVDGINKMNDGGFQIDFSKFSILPGLLESDVLQSVQAFPGIQSINETVSNLNVRGGTHDQNLILWDNIKMYQSGHFFGLISMFNPNITKKVSVYKNGTNVQYTDGVSSTISMFTDQDITDQIIGNVSFSFIDVNSYIDTPIGNKSSLQLALRKSLSDFWQTPTYSSYFNRISQNTEVANNETNIRNSDKKFDFYDASLRWLYKINAKNNLRINFIVATNELVFTESSILSGIDKSRESSLTQTSIASGIEYTREWNSKFKTSVDIYNTDYKLKAFNVNLNRSQRFLQENIVSETGIRLNTFLKLSDVLNWQNGYQFIETGVTNLDDVDDPVFRDYFVEVLRSHSLFSNVKLSSKSRRLFLNAGVRYSYLDKFYKSILEPRLSFSYKITNDLTFEIQGEFKHQTTSQIINFQNDFLGIENRRWELTNNDSIPIIQSKQISSAFQFEKKGWLLSTDIYYKDVKGITTRSQGFTNNYEFVKEKGSYTASGIDVLIRKRINKFYFWTSYSYLENEYYFEGLLNRKFPSNFDITHTVTTGITYQTNSLKIGTGFNWRTGTPTTNLDTLNPSNSDNTLNYNEPNSDKLQDYFRVDISAIYHLPFKNDFGIDIGASLWNVLDNQNSINQYFRLGNDDQPIQINQYSLGIVPNFLLKINF